MRANLADRIIESRTWKEWVRKGGWETLYGAVGMTMFYNIIILLFIALSLKMFPNDPFRPFAYVCIFQFAAMTVGFILVLVAANLLRPPKKKFIRVQLGMQIAMLSIYAYFLQRLFSFFTT